MGSTIEYYNQNAQSFADGTAAVNFTEIQNVFLELVPEGGYILDFGCGSGRDTKDFLDQGYRVEATDGSEILCKLASKYTGISVKHMFFEELEEIEKSNKTLIIYEAPHKLKSTLQDLKLILSDDRKITLAREITKIHEEFIRGNIDYVIENSEDIKGEIVLIIEGNSIVEENELNKLSLEEHYKFYEEMGLDKKEIIKKIAKDRKVNKNEIYKEFIKKKY